MHSVYQPTAHISAATVQERGADTDKKQQHACYRAATKVTSTEGDPQRLMLTFVYQVYHGESALISWTITVAQMPAEVNDLMNIT